MATQGSPRPRAPWGAFARTGLLAAAVLGVVAVAAAIQGAGTGAITGGVEALASGSGTLLDRVAAWLPFGFAFGAGMVSAVNPCGFVMLPAYLGLFVGSSATARLRPAARFARAGLVSLSTTAGFVLVFALAGGAVALAARTVAGALPWVGLATGVALVSTGAFLTDHTGGGPTLPSMPGLAPRRQDARSFATFGVAYALASLSCTLPIFLAVIGGALALPTLATAVGELLAYALGMGAVVTVVTGLVAGLQTAAARRLAGLGRRLNRLGAPLLLLAGAYVTYYWLTVGGLLRAG